MKKNFPLKAPGKEDARVRDKIRHEINKYVRRERKKTVPEGFDLWNLNCKVGASAETAGVLPLKEVGGAIDKVAAEGAESVFVEVVAVAGHRTFKRPL
jgi:hypothetical protein